MSIHHIHQPKESNNQTYSSNQRNLVIALLITAIVMIAEIIGGLLANSLALLSDAGHMLTDINFSFKTLVHFKLLQRFFRQSHRTLTPQCGTGIAQRNRFFKAK
jgi:cobalt-zinc-cadmium efflux system protein